MAKYIIVDVETDGPIPGDNSMLSLGACTLDEPEQTWYTEIKPIRLASYNPQTVEFLKNNGLDREEVKKNGMFPNLAMESFDRWLTEVAQGDRLRFVSDNAAFDPMFVFWYLHHFVGTCQFGFGALSLTSLYAGITGEMKRANEYKKKYRTVGHSHNALDDSRGNAGALRTMISKGLIKL